MSDTPRYMVERIGDRYVPVPVHATDTAGAWVYRMGGGALALLGVMRGGLRGWFASVIGAGLMYRGFTGRSVMSLRRAATSSRRRDGEPRQTPSYQNDATKRSSMLPADKVDEMSMESFPASDPPGKIG